MAVGTGFLQHWLHSRISLKNKIILFTCISVLFSTLLVGIINYYRVEKIVLDTAVEKLAGETRLMAQRFKFSYDLMKSDVEVLSQTPPIQGLCAVWPGTKSIR
jgi:sensor histidine kinase regulating citrate/malate metabolism